MEGYLVAILDNSSKPTEYWTDNGFKDDVTQATIYSDPKEAIANFAGLQARYNTVELKVFRCKSTVEIIPGNPFAEVETVVTPTTETTATTIAA